MTDSNLITRRRFVRTSASLGAAIAAVRPAPGSLGSNDRIRVAVIGTGGRGTNHVDTFKVRKDIELVAICDVDDAQLDAASKTAAAWGGEPKRYKDFRQVLDLTDVDAVFIATCCHWHAPIAIRAMKAGKDVYLEKPSGHTVHECCVVADTAKETNRIVQIGTQQRSSPHWIHAVERIKAGELGQITAVHVWNAWSMSQMGGNLGNPPDSDPPAGVDYDMWLGPAPKHRFNPARFHFNFYFFFDYSNGMTVAWGVHLFDIVMWALGNTLKSATANGWIYALKDIRETPDTLQAIFDCGDYVIDYSLCHTNNWPRFGKMDHGIEFVGTKGVMQINREEFNLFHQADKLDAKPYYSERVNGHDTVNHHANFFECIRSRKVPASDAETGFHAALPGHLATVSWKVGRSVRWDEKDNTIPGDAEAVKLLTKQYRAPWSL